MKQNTNQSESQAGLTIPQRYKIVQQANERQIYIDVHGKQFKAQLVGVAKDFPSIVTVGKCFHGVDIGAEISWELAQRLANGTVQAVKY